MEKSASADRALTLIVNGEPVTTTAQTLAELVVEAGHGSAKVATALNGDFVPERMRAHTRLTNRDRIEILSPRQGG